MTVIRSEPDASRSLATRLPWALRSFELPQPFQESIEHLQSDEIKAVMALRLLSLIALDPLVLARKEQYTSQHGDHICFRLVLHRTVNPIGLFDLPEASPLCAQLLEAIETNLTGKMFKAAKLSRRLEPMAIAARKRHRAYVTFDEKGELDTSVYAQLGERLRRRLAAIDDVAAPGTNKGYSNWLAGFVSASMSQM